jgi:hypothetical protein
MPLNYRQQVLMLHYLPAENVRKKITAIDFLLSLQRKIYKKNMMIRNIKTVERTAFQQQVKTVKAVHTDGMLCEMAAKIGWNK